MNVLIIESNESLICRRYTNLSVVHVRTSVVIADALNADLISKETQIKNIINKKYDAIICVYSSGYMKYNKYLEVLIKNKDAKIFWIINEYSISDNIILRKFVEQTETGYDVIANLDRSSYNPPKQKGTILKNRLTIDWMMNWHNVNLNCLIFDLSFVRKVDVNLFTSKKEDCVYYSTFRPDRIKDLLDYNSANYGISTSKKNIIKFKENNITARFGGKMSWEKGKETLFNYKYSLYIEDTHTHTNYNYMANRFYECLMLDVIIFYDYRCKQTIERSGYFIDDFVVVKNGEELNEKIKQVDESEVLYEKILSTQRSNFDLILKEKEFTLDKIKNILSSDREIKEIEKDKLIQEQKKIRKTKQLTQIQIFHNEGM